MVSGQPSQGTSGAADRVESILAGYVAEVEAVTAEFRGKLQEASELLESVTDEDGARREGGHREQEMPGLRPRRRRGPDLFE